MNDTDAPNLVLSSLDFDADFVVSAPGRVNLIGEHTDYSLGLVLPMAVEQRTWLAAARRKDSRLRMVSTAFEGPFEIPLQNVAQWTDHPHWTRYVTGILDEMGNLGYSLPGLDLAIFGDLPVARGLSSSASLEMAVVHLVETLCHRTLPDVSAAKLGQRVEHERLGVACGLMDQLAVRCARKGHALLLNCKTLDTESLPIESSIAMVVADTGVRRNLTASAFNQRVAVCQEAAHVLARHRGSEIAADTALSEFSLADLDATRSLLDEVTYRRAHHVLSENSRVLEAATALKSRDWHRLGQLMNASHRSLASDYEVSCKELDVLTQIARAREGCLGSRMTGAGFGGCTVSLVQTESVESFVRDASRSYRDATGRETVMTVTRGGTGPCTHREPPPEGTAARTEHPPPSPPDGATDRP